MAEQLALGFGGLLRQLRAEAGLTQEELAEAAGLSPRSVSDLERGINRTARKDTAELLAGALGLAGPARPLFMAAARGRAPAEEVLAALREAAAPEGPAPGPRGRAALIWGSCRLRSGTPGCFTDATSWPISWCGGWASGWTGRGYCWWPGSRGRASPRCCGRGCCRAWPAGAGAGIGAVAAAGDPAHRQPAAGAGDAPGRDGRCGSGVGVPVAVGGAG